MRVVAAPTGVFTIVGRVQLNGEADLPAVHTLQDQFTITPLAVRAGAAPADVAGAPQPDPRVREELRWWEQFRVALAAFPPPAADKQFVTLAERFGATNAESPYVDPGPRWPRCWSPANKRARPGSRSWPGAAGMRPVVGAAPCTRSTTTWTTSAWAPSKPPNGRPPTASRPMSCGRWRLAPGGAFRPIMRMYQPQQPILDGTYVLPAVRKVG